MNYLKLKSRAILPVLIALFVTFFFTACSKKMRFETSAEAPAAQGAVKVKKDDNNNYKIDLNITRLTEPEKLNPPKNTYVVWMETDRDGTIKIGGLTTSSGIFSKTLKSSLETVTPYQPVMFYITAENSKDVERPGFQTVLRTKHY